MFGREKAAAATEQGYNTKLIRHTRSGRTGGIEWTGHLTRAMANKLPLISPGIRAKLETARVARLATLDAERRPHMVPICFAYDGSVFYSAIDRKPKRVAPSRLARLKNIKETPQVALLVDQYDEDWTRLWYVLVRGAAQLVAASAEHNRAIQRLRANKQRRSSAEAQERALSWAPFLAAQRAQP